MFVTVECEAAVIGCCSTRPGSDVNIPSVLALPGADHVLARLPEDRWALLSHKDETEIRATLAAHDLPAPKLVVAAVERTATHYLDAADALHADPAVCLAFEDTPDGIAVAREAGLQVVGIAAHSDPDSLAAADFVVPSLLSVRVLGSHPFLVFEVDAIPDLGTGAGRRR